MNANPSNAQRLVSQSNSTVLTVGDGQVRYTFAEAGSETLFVTAHKRCSDGMLRSFLIGQLLDAESENPLLMLKAPLGVNAVQDVCSIVRQIVARRSEMPLGESPDAKRVRQLVDLRKMLCNLADPADPAPIEDWRRWAGGHSRALDRIISELNSELKAPRRCST